MRALLPVLISTLLLMPAAAHGATLIELRAGGEPLRLVVDRPQQRVLIASAARRTWFDLNGGFVYHLEGAGPARRAHARYRPGHDRPAPYRIERFGPGPVVAGQASTYEVLFVDDRICAEMMLSEWMRPFLDPAIRTIALIQQTLGAERADPCATIPFGTYAAAGWPLMAGKSDHPTLETRTIAFDHEAAPEELTPPAAFVEVPLEQLQGALGAYGF
ncbi:MAG TPA: hypothetical protein VHK45_02270 [Geminicoccaceae bacterium]|jgi:hypothetical protein|nr:hypothetical protein [Geminicoccaceae bacterium]